MFIAIIGLPNSTKTTVFNALTKGQVETAAYSSGTLAIHRTTVDVPDPRVDSLSRLFNPRKTTYAQVTYADIAGLDKGVGEGGLSGPTLNILSQADALLHVVRAFEDAEIPHSQDSIDPRRDVDIIDTELLLSDLIIVERKLDRLKSQLSKGSSKQDKAIYEAELALFERLHHQLSAEAPLRDMDLTASEHKLLRPYGLLTQKPVLVLLNVGDEDEQPALMTLSDYTHQRTNVAALHGHLEMELSQMSAEEAAEFLPEYGIQEPGMNRVIRLSYQLLGLQSFFTVGADEVRAWTVPVGSTAVEAAGAIHTDLARGFIRAEVISYDQMMAAGTMAKARQQGLVRLEGKEYVLKDGDILSIRFNV